MSSTFRSRVELHRPARDSTSKEHEDFFAKEGPLTEVLSDEVLHNIIRPIVKGQGRPMVDIL